MEYMSILHLDYPQFKIEDEIKRLKENAEYLRDVYLYPELPFYAYLSDDNRLNSLILVNRKPSSNQNYCTNRHYNRPTV